MQPNCGLFKTGLLVCWMAIAGLTVTYPAGAQTTDPAPAPGDTGTTKPAIKKLQIRTVEDLDFGKVAADRVFGGTITLHPNSGRKAAAQGIDLGGLSGRAQFEVTGEPNKRFVITLPDEVIVKNSAGRDMVVTGFRVNGKPIDTVIEDKRIIGKLANDGKATLFVGATLKLHPQTGAGKGRRSVEIFVDYLSEE